MAEPKTKKNDASVTAYLNAISDKQKRADCKVIAKMMRAATGNRTGKSCLNLKKLDDVDQEVLNDLISGTVKEMRRIYK